MTNGYIKMFLMYTKMYILCEKCLLPLKRYATCIKLFHPGIKSIADTEAGGPMFCF